LPRFARARESGPAEGAVLSRFLLPSLAAALLLLPQAGLADATASASYVVSLGGNIIATADFTLALSSESYDLKLNANVTGLASLVAAGIARAESNGAVTAEGLEADAFNLVTHSGGKEFRVQVQYTGGEVTAFVVTPPIVNNIDRVPIERKQLTQVNDMLAAFVLRRARLDRSVCDYRAQVFTGIERFDLDFDYARDDTATSPRTGYQGPVVLCKINYKPISGHFTTSELTNSLAEDDRILVWYMPLSDTGYFIPYRVLLTTSMGDLSMVLTKLE
jgi:hypothetical protein